MECNHPRIQKNRKVLARLECRKIAVSILSPALFVMFLRDRVEPENSYATAFFKQIKTASEGRSGGTPAGGHRPHDLLDFTGMKSAVEKLNGRESARWQGDGSGV